MPLVTAASQIVVSPEGKWLAILTNRTGTIRSALTIWNAGTGELRWQFTEEADQGADSYSVAFEPDGERLTVFDGAAFGRFSEWNITTRQPVAQAPLTGKPSSGVDGACGFDRAALRMFFSGVNELGLLRHSQRQTDVDAPQRGWRAQHDSSVPGWNAAGGTRGIRK